MYWRHPRSVILKNIAMCIQKILSVGQIGLQLVIADLDENASMNMINVSKTIAAIWHS